MFHVNNEAQLSDRELEILELVATGISNKEIAEELSISQNTVKVHLRNIFSKLGVSTRTEAALTAIQTNLVEFNGFSPNDVLPSDPNSRRIQVSPAETRVNRWTLSLALVGILFLGLVGMLILLRQDESRVDEISTIAPDVESDRWKELAGLPTARNGLALVTYENLIFAIGGENVDGVTGAAERYDPIDDTWIQLTQKPTPVTDVMGVVVGGKVYIPGGRLPSGELTDKYEVYNPIEDIWEQKA